MEKKKIEITMEKFSAMSEREKLYIIGETRLSGCSVYVGSGHYKWTIARWLQIHDHKFLNKYRAYFNIFINGFGG